jgi:predicted transcriptional regulator of viral defense system
MDTTFLEENPIITKATIKKTLGCSDDYAYTVLNRLLNKKKIYKIIKGKYTTKNDIYFVATNLFNPSYLSFWSCAYFKGYTEQIVNTIQLATSRPHKKIFFQNYIIESHTMPKKMFFGYEKILHNQGFIFVADDEKLVIDAIYKEDLMGNFDEIIKMIEKTKIDKEKVTHYLNSINNSSLKKREGFILEKYKNIDISENMRYKDKNYVKLSSYKKNNKLDPKWMVEYDL